LNSLESLSKVIFLNFISEYLHGITQRKVDEINDKVMNREFLEYKEGEKLKRGNRISILIWSE
jgi:hypothetical protein